MIRTAAPLFVLSAALQAATPDDPIADWYGIPVPDQWSLVRSDMGMAGAAEPSCALVDGLSGKGRNRTRVGLSFQKDHADLSDGAWSRHEAGFDLSAVFDGLDGLGFGVDVLSVEPQPSSSSEQVSWKVEDPLGGLRLGIAADALRPLHSKDWSWGLGAWIPVFSPSMEWEALSGLVYARRLRVDLSLARNHPSAPAVLSEVDGDTTLSDTAWWRTRQTRWTARVGFSPFDELAIQAWGGSRRQEDPGADGDPGWRLSGSSWFLGAQGTWDPGPATLEGEVRWDRGSESAVFDTGSGCGWMAPTGEGAGHARHSLADGRLELRAAGFRPGRLRLRPLAAVQAAWERLDGWESGTVIAAWSDGGTWGELHRREGELGLRVDLPWLSLEPRLGLQRRTMDGDPPRLWWGFPSSGSSWTLPWKVRVFREGAAGMSLSYRISGEIFVSGSSSYRAGLRQEASLGQDF